ncbi:MAG: SGNH/GDSL hydrolase family protein [Planctomycetota bacterium]
MQTLSLLGDGPVRLAGAADCLVDFDGVRPQRILQRYAPLAAPELLDAAALPTGVRLEFVTDADAVELELDALAHTLSYRKAGRIDLVVDDGEPITRDLLPCARQTVRYEGLGGGRRRVALYLPTPWPVRLRALRVSDGATVRPAPRRPAWLTYGSSITHCGEPYGPASTWPALVARAAGLDLWNMGFGGNGWMDCAAARTIAALPVDRISLKLAVNTMCGVYDDRTFVSAAEHMVLTIRDQQPTVPILVVSPFFCRRIETTPNRTGMTLRRMRFLDARLVKRLRACGDPAVHYLDGLRIFGEADEPLFCHDGGARIHPNAEAQFRIADRFLRAAFAPGAPLAL